ACYGIVQVPTGPWFCRKCESQERAARVRCELCPHKDGALKRTDNGGWAHVVCALYIPEVQFANVLTMEPIVLQYVPHDRFSKTCYICEEQGRESKAASGACMTCNRHGCRQAFHVTCAQMAGLLCEEEVLEVDNVKYCGYCKYHFNKMKTARHPGGSRGWGDAGGQAEVGKAGGQAGAGGMRRGGGGVGGQSGPTYLRPRVRKGSGPVAQHSTWNSKYNKKNRKDKERPKQKHKKRPESPTSLTPSSVPVPAEKVPDPASTAHHEGIKETSEVSRSEVKGKKSSSHGTSHKGKKTGSGKNSSLQCSQEFVTFPKLEQEEEKYRKPVSSTSSSSHCSPLYEGQKGDVFEQKVIFSGFGSIMRFSTSAVSQQRGHVASPVDYKASNPVSGPSGGGGGPSHKRMPSLSIEDGEVLKEKKHKGSKKSKHGPGRGKGGKNKEVPGTQLAGSTVTSSSPFSGGSLVSSSIGNSSRSFSHTATLPSLSLESPLLGSGIYTSNKDPISHGAGVLRAVCSTPLSSSLLAHQGTSSLPQLRRRAFLHCTGNGCCGDQSTSQVFSLAGSTFSLPSSHIFGSPLTSGLSMNPLLNQSESSRAEPDLEDCSFGCRGTSPQESLSSIRPPSTRGGLPGVGQRPCGAGLRQAKTAASSAGQSVGQRGSGEGGVCNTPAAPGACHGAALWAGGGGVRKPGSEILVAHDATPEPTIGSTGCPFAPPWRRGAPPLTIDSRFTPAVCNSDSLSISKSSPCKNSFGIENSLSTSSEPPSSPAPSPPPPSCTAARASSVCPQTDPSTRRVRGKGNVAIPDHTHAPRGIISSPMCARSGAWLVALLGAGNGVQTCPTRSALLGAGNGVQTCPTRSGRQQATLTCHLPCSVPGLSPLTEQQRHVLQQHEHQQQQLQQLNQTSQLNREQQALVFQMMQQIQQKRELQRLQMTGTSQLPMTNLLTATSAPLLHSSATALMTSAAPPPPSGSSLLASISPQQLNPSNSLMGTPTASPLSAPGNNLMAAGAGVPPVLSAQANPFLTLQADGSAQKGTSMSEKGAALNQDKG
uniref:MLLT6, PHD finger containing n=1 Tax=Pelodiscus sinensis TaxID=13735 RepID=K7FTZ2_PELSI